MPLPLTNLDDRSYADLVEEAIALIPVEAPEWTDHNPADTGIILIELLAWLTEMILYRVNQIPHANQAAFLSLLKGVSWSLPAETSTAGRNTLLQAEVQKTLAQLRRPYRAVTIKDFEQLILSDWLQTRTAQTKFKSAAIARVHCLPERDLEFADIDQSIEAHISLVILPEKRDPEHETLKKTLKRFLDQRRLLTTRLHIVDPNYVTVSISTTLNLYDGTKFENVQKEAKRRLTAFFAPQKSQEYWQGQGYPFGANIYISEIYELLDHLPGVDYVEKVELSNFEPDRQQFNEQNEFIGLTIREHELVAVEVGQIVKF